MCIFPTFSVFFPRNKSPKQHVTLCCSRFQCIALQKCFYCHAVPKAPACLVIYYIIPFFPSRGNILVSIASSFFHCILFYGGLPAEAVIRFWPYFPSLSFNVKKSCNNLTWTTLDLLLSEGWGDQVRQPGGVELRVQAEAAALGLSGGVGLSAEGLEPGEVALIYC